MSSFSAPVVLLTKKECRLHMQDEIYILLKNISQLEISDLTLNRSNTTPSS
jgi:hypothetical protein